MTWTDMNICILFLHVSQHCSRNVFFRQGTGSSIYGITYHDRKSLANHLGEVVYKIMPTLHTLIGCDYTVLFFGRSKNRIFENIQKHSNAEKEQQFLTNPSFLLKLFDDVFQACLWL